MTNRSGQQILDAEMLQLRAKLLEMASTLDRIERGDEPKADGHAMDTVQQALQTLLRTGGSRAERIQLLFSRSYDAAWRETWEV